MKWLLILIIICLAISWRPPCSMGVVCCCMQSSFLLSLFCYLILSYNMTFGQNWCPLRAPLTLSDPGYFRQLTIRGGGALKAPHPPPPPYDLENYCVNLHHIIHVHFTRYFGHVPIGIFQIFAILAILQRFQNKK